MGSEGLALGAQGVYGRMWTCPVMMKSLGKV